MKRPLSVIVAFCFCAAVFVVFSLLFTLYMLVIKPAYERRQSGQEKTGASPGRDSAVQTGDFAGTLELSGSAGSLLSFEIPESVFRGLERPDMGDMRIYDSRGNPAPFLVRALPGTVTARPEQNVPLFVWNETSRSFGAAGTPEQAAQSPNVEIRATGVEVIINPRGGEEGGVYLADLSEIAGARPSRLILDFEKPAHFNSRVRIRSSGDLAEWKDSGRTQIAAYYGSEGTDKNEFGIPEDRYILISFERKTPPVLSAAAVFDPAETPALRETRFAGKTSADGKTVFYDAGGFFPAVQVNFILVRPDSIHAVIGAEAERENAESPPAESAWIGLGESAIFRIERPGKAPLVNDPIALGRYGRAGPGWKIESYGEQVFTQAPEMALFWEAREIVFLASGEGPWTLAWGNRACPPPPRFFGADAESALPSAGEVPPAAPGRETYQKRDAARDGFFAAGARKQIALWGVLIAAAAALSGMAVWVIKSSKTVETKNNGKEHNT